MKRTIRRFHLNSIVIVVLTLLLLLFFFFQKYSLHRVAPVSTPEATTSAQVKKVIDGDTIDVVVDGATERVRLIGIDAPEFGYDGKPAMCFAGESYKKAKELLDGKKVRMDSDSTQDERDKYNRLLRYVFLEDGTNINEALITQGFAREYTYLGNPYRYQKEFQEGEKTAKLTGKGVWQAGACP